MTLSRKLLVVAALAGGLLAAFAGEPLPPPDGDEVGARQLAEWIRQQRPGLRVIDLRPADATGPAGLPGALAAADLDTRLTAGALTLVVYADGDIDHRIAESLRARWPQATLLRLHGGLAAWSAEVMYPEIRADAPARRRAGFAERAALSRYFGGTPRVRDAATEPARSRSRQGC